MQQESVRQLEDGRYEATLTLEDGSSLTFYLDMTTLNVYAVTNQKGGVGKSPTSVNLAFAIVRVIKKIFGVAVKVLLVDMDPQASLSEYFLGDQADDQEITILDALIGGPIEGPHGKPKPIAPIVINDNIHMLGAHDALAAAEIIVPTLSNTEKRLSAVLKHYRKSYQFVVIDCPPSLGILNKNALAAANKILIPVKTERSAERTLKLISRSIEDVVESELNANMQVWGILPTLYDGRKNHHRKVLVDIHTKYEGEVYPVASIETTKYNDATELRADVSVLDPKLGVYWDDLALSILTKETPYSTKREERRNPQWQTASKELVAKLTAQLQPENGQATTTH